MNNAIGRQTPLYANSACVAGAPPNSHPPEPLCRAVLGNLLLAMGYHGMAWASMGMSCKAMENIGFFRFWPIWKNPDMNVNKDLADTPDNEC
jgi:hypothetical protein